MCKLAFFLLAFVAAVLAAPSDDGLESVELIYEDEDLVPVELDDDSEEVRFLFKNSKGENRCKCTSGNSCSCCATPSIPFVGKFEGCINVELDNENKELDVKILAQGNTLINKKVSTKATEKICDSLPGGFGGVKVCLYTTTTDLEDKTGVQSCPRIDVMKESNIVAKITFACVQFKDEKLSLNDNGEVKSNELFKIKAGDPIKGVLSLLGIGGPLNEE